MAAVEKIAAILLIDDPSLGTADPTTLGEGFSCRKKRRLAFYCGPIPNRFTGNGAIAILTDYKSSDRTNPGKPVMRTRKLLPDIEKFFEDRGAQ